MKEKEKTEENGAPPNADTPPGEWPEICGCTISVRQNEDIISVWNKSEADARVKEKVKCGFSLACMSPSSLTRREIPCNPCLLQSSTRETIKRALNLPASIVMEYKSNNGASAKYCRRLNWLILLQQILCRTSRVSGYLQASTVRHYHDKK